MFCNIISLHGSCYAEKGQREQVCKLKHIVSKAEWPSLLWLFVAFSKYAILFWPGMCGVAIFACVI